MHCASTSRQARAVELLDQVGLPSPEQRLNNFPHQLSGGQKARVGIARAVALEPKFLILDEPTTALDVTTQIEVLAAIRGIVREYNTAAIYITHDLAVVAQMADKIKVLLRGEEVEESSARDMLANPQQDYTKSLWAVRDFRRAPPAARHLDEGPLLEIRDMTAGYGAVDILKGINLTITRGTTVAVVGESGSGKSTMLNVISGIYISFPPRFQFIKGINGIKIANQINPWERINILASRNNPSSKNNTHTK